MAEPDPRAQRRSRIVIAIFVGVALLLAVTTIVQTIPQLPEPEPTPAASSP